MRGEKRPKVEAKSERVPQPKEGALKVWHIPQIPGKAFEVPVGDVVQAMHTLMVLADYDLFQYRNRIKPDYANAQGLSVYEDGEWGEWSNEEGDDIGALTRKARAS